ncbi:hypothetical protein HHI36_002043 [Cryptolaemus montrouzieri]|uniref:Uncharacterized protein n=1 Tax=Cryptolaemus montrouzieri TaxID=559131 RepID=A0ABD2PA24_9CUCU
MKAKTAIRNNSPVEDSPVPPKNIHKGGKKISEICYFIKLMNMNVQSIANKKDSLKDDWDSEKCYIICLTEHWLQKEKLGVFALPGFNVARSFCHANFKREGSMIIVREKFKCICVYVNTLSKQILFASTGRPQGIRQIHNANGNCS